MTTTKPFQLGSISTGTLRTDDLLRAFGNILEQLTESSFLTRNAYRLTTMNHASQQECDDVIAELEEALQELCPPFVYFGAHPGDGADFGFWPDWDALQGVKDNEHSAFQAGHHFTLDDCIVYYHENTAVTVMNLDRNVLWSTS